jgi:Ca2+-binding EF-hand superfamily protein
MDNLSSTNPIVELFKEHDTDGNGYIDQEELSFVLEDMGFLPEESDAMFQAADLNLDGKIKYQEFVTWVFRPQAGDAKQEAKVEAAVEAVVGNVEASEGPSDPARRFLKRAYSVLADHVTELHAVATEGGDISAVKAKEEAKVAEFHGLLSDSFDNHDTSKDGSLEAAEAKIFFSHLVEEAICFFDYIAIESIKKMVEHTVEALTRKVDNMARENPDMTQERHDQLQADIQSEMRSKLDKQINSTREELQAKMADYHANKAARDGAAFKLLDADDGGGIEKKEFIEAFSPGTDKHMQLMGALGLPC